MGGRVGDSLLRDVDDYEAFYREVEPRVRAALIARYGVDVGVDASSEAMSYAWEHWSELREMHYPVAFLFRVGQSRSRRLLRRGPHFPALPEASNADVEPGVASALASLTTRQRVSVVLSVGYGLSDGEIAQILGIRPTTVQNHRVRGLANLRKRMGVGNEG